MMKSLCEENCSGDILCSQFQTRSNEHLANVTVIQESSEEALSEHGSNVSKRKGVVGVGGQRGVCVF